MPFIELPLNGRNSSTCWPRSRAPRRRTATASRQAGSYSIGGMRSDSVTYLLDGGKTTISSITMS